MPTLYAAQPGRVESFLPTVPLLADLEPAAIRALAAGTTVHSYDVGETIVREGDAADALYVILKGTVRAVSSPDRAAPGREVSLTKLGAGDHFGEVGLVEHAPRTATCRVAGEEPAFVIRIAAGAVEPVIAAHPRLRETILKLGDFYRTWNFLKVSTSLGDALGPEALRAFVGMLELRSFAKNDVVVREGDATAPLAIVRSGFVRLVRAGTPVGVLGEGRHWGEDSLLEGAASRGELRATADEVEVLLAPRAPLTKLVESTPGLRDFFSRNPCVPVDASVVSPLPRSFQVKDQDPTVYLGLKAVPVRATPTPGPVPSPAAVSRGPIHRFPLVRQHDEADCGPAALSMVARFHGKRVGIGRIRDLARSSSQGASLAGLAEAAQALGFMAHGARVSPEALDGKPLPAIAHWGGSGGAKVEATAPAPADSGTHFVVIYRLSAREAWIADPAIGLRCLTRAELALAYSGTLLLLEPTERLGGVRAAKGGLGRFLEQLGPHTRGLVLIALASVVVDLVSLAGPLGTQAVIDRAIGPGEPALLPLLLAGLAVAAVFRIVTQALRATLVADLSLRLDLRSHLKLFFHVLSLPLAFFRLRRPGEVLSRFAESARVRSVLAGSALYAVFDVVLVALVLVVMLLESPKLLLAVLAFVPLSLLVTLALTPALRRRSERALAATAEQEALLVDSITAVETVKSLAIERTVRWRWEARLAESLGAVRDSARLEVALGSLTDALGAAGSLVLLGYGASLVLAHELTVGQLVAFQALFASVLAPIRHLVALWDQVQEANLSLERVDSVLDCEPEDTLGPAMLVDPRALLKGRIRCDRVFFRYSPESAFALEALSLEIGAGASIGILGRSGSGKTTLARLLLKLDLATEGHLLIDDLDITAISAPGLRRSVGFVAQDVHLFLGTVAENIAFGAPEPDRARVEEAARIADAHGFVSALPQGYDTLLGERGLGLSGGQRQRIAVARALYHNPKVLILDEATSALDVEAEARVLGSVRSASAGRTTIVLSHRVSAVRDAGRILVLERGRLVEDGSHAELIQAPGIYRDLAKREGV